MQQINKKVHGEDRCRIDKRMKEMAMDECMEEE